MAELVRITSQAPGEIVIPNVLIQVYDGAGVYVTSGTTDGYGRVEFTLEAGNYTARAFRAGYETPDPEEFTISETLVSLESAYPIPIERGGPVILVGYGFNPTPSNNLVTFSTETDPVTIAGETVSDSRDILVLHAPSNIQFGDVVSTSVYVTKPDPVNPGETLQSNTLVTGVEAET